MTCHPNDGERLAEAAAAMIGCPFRLHGRNPSTGLDCVGLVVASMKSIGRRVSPPSGYGMRNVAVDQWLSCARESGFTEAVGRMLPGDVVLSRVGPAQHHLMIAESPGSAIHAHAGLRQVVRQPLDPELVFAAHWRLVDPDEGHQPWPQ